MKKKLDDLIDRRYCVSVMIIMIMIMIIIIMVIMIIIIPMTVTLEGIVIEDKEVQ
jgi:hypothetical protein